MPTTLTPYGGVAEIGGNKFLLEDSHGRLFFDFGKAIGRYHRYFDGIFLDARPQRGLLDWLALELLPPLPGLLRDDLIPVFDPADLTITDIPPQGRQRKARTRVELSDSAREAFWAHWQNQFPTAYRDLRQTGRPAVDAILLSHAHLDHIGDMAFVSPDVPVSGTRMTAFISKVLLDTGPAGQSGAPFLRLRAPTPEGLLRSDDNHREYTLRPWHFLDDAPNGASNDDPLDNAFAFWATPPGKESEVAPVLRSAPPRLIEHWPVDHSLLGGVGYAAETDAGWVGYTGDIRFHGRNGAHTQAFAERLAELRLSALLCEGTHLHAPTKTTEAQVYENCLRAVRRAGGQLVIADFAPRNVERLLAFVEISQATGRCLLVQPKDAYLLRAMYLADPDALADIMQHPHVCVYADPKTMPAAWEYHVRARYASRTLTPAQVQKHPGDYILALSLLDMADLLDLDYLMQREPGGLYIFSNSPAYDDEQNVDLVRLWNWTQRLGLMLIGLRPMRDQRGTVTRIESEPGYHASGHAGGDELLSFVKTVRPKTLIPIHTTSPEHWVGLLAGTEIEVVMPEYGKPILIRHP